MHTCMHACMHACIHTYIHFTYMQVLKATGQVEADFSLACKLLDTVSTSGVTLDIYTYNSLVAATALQAEILKCQTYSP